MRIFISYSSKNRSLIETLANDLEALGHDVWFDKELSGGQVWWDQILGAIRDCELCVFALTPQSLESYPCRLEYTYAAAMNKRILPVMMDTVDTDVLPSALAAVQIVDNRRADRQSGFNLSRAITKLPASKPLPDPLPPPPSAPLSPLARIRDEIEAQSLSFEKQASIIMELKELVNHRETAAGARQLMTQLRRRRTATTDPSAKPQRSSGATRAGSRYASQRASTAISARCARWACETRAGFASGGRGNCGVTDRGVGRAAIAWPCCQYHEHKHASNVCFRADSKRSICHNESWPNCICVRR